MATRCLILNPNTLRGRLGICYASALVVALALFAAIALVVVDRAQRAALDAQLQSTAGALRVVGDVRGNRLVVDAKDRDQFHTVAGATQSAIVSSDGTILISSSDQMARALVALRRGRNVDAFADVDDYGNHLRIFAAGIANGARNVGTTFAWGDLDVIAKLDRSVALGFAFAIPLIAGLAIVVGGELSRRILVPLERIATLASEIEGHDFSRRLGLPARRDELGRLGATFDRMLDRLQCAFDLERRFASDASHELRAPLSVIRAEADLALRQHRTQAEYRRLGVGRDRRGRSHDGDRGRTAGEAPDAYGCGRHGRRQSRAD